MQRETQRPQRAGQANPRNPPRPPRSRQRAKPPPGHPRQCGYYPADLNQPTLTPARAATGDRWVNGAPHAGRDSPSHDETKAVRVNQARPAERGLPHYAIAPSNPDRRNDLSEPPECRIGMTPGAAQESTNHSRPKQRRTALVPADLNDGARACPIRRRSAMNHCCPQGMPSRPSSAVGQERPLDTRPLPAGFMPCPRP
jgi:hypothetical protein